MFNGFNPESPFSPEAFDFSKLSQTDFAIMGILGEEHAATYRLLVLQGTPPQPFVNLGKTYITVDGIDFDITSVIPPTNLPSPQAGVATLTARMPEDTQLDPITKLLLSNDPLTRNAMQIAGEGWTGATAPGTTVGRIIYEYAGMWPDQYTNEEIADTVLPTSVTKSDGHSLDELPWWVRKQMEEWERLETERQRQAEEKFRKWLEQIEAQNDLPYEKRRQEEWERLEAEWRRKAAEEFEKWLKELTEQGRDLLGSEWEQQWYERFLAEQRRLSKNPNLLTSELGDDKKGDGKDDKEISPNFVDKETGKIGGIATLEDLFTGKGEPLSLSEKIKILNQSGELGFGSDKELSIEEAARIAKEMFGHELTPQQLAALSGAYFADRILVDYTVADKETLPIHILSMYAFDERLINVQAGQELSYWISLIRKENNLVLQNNQIFLNTGEQAKGVGRLLTTSQAEGAIRLGINTIKLDAIRNDQKEYIGYKVWPKYGYDAPLPEEIISRLPPNFRDAQYLSDLLATDKGKEWWEQFGVSMRLTFDLSTDSKNLANLRRYLRRYGDYPNE